MKNATTENLRQRMSLRKPQSDSLELLADICAALPPEKDRDLGAALEQIRSVVGGFKSFDREFMSLCFSLATGVGKTRLMGAFAAYLHEAHGVNHFFVVAPNLTIYDKLVTDFTPGTPKYVFWGIEEFAQNPPLIITGENYEQMGAGSLTSIAYTDRVCINIFNIAKFSGKDNTMRRLSEYLGESYFSYLAGLPDLVLLMDESHRYRATAGMRALNELHPALGLEFTATPQVEQGNKSVRFGNIVYEYLLASAIHDGFVKDPAVATREDFHPEDYSPEELERIKLEDGIRLHRNVKAELTVYAREEGRAPVKPFMLVVARDTAHADALRDFMESGAFFGGEYRGKVLTVHSKSGGKANRNGEGDETVRLLLTVEKPDNPVEIVIHVNMLKEGWDVTNLYTIVPLRKGDSRTLVEQSIGRGLRLPYGTRTGVQAVDRLTIVFHDHFQEVIEDARRKDSIIQQTVIMERELPDGDKQAVHIPSRLTRLLDGQTSPAANIPTDLPADLPDSVPSGSSSEELPAPLRNMKEDTREKVDAVLNVIESFTTLPDSSELERTEILDKITKRAAKRLPPEQICMGVPEGLPPSLPEVVKAVVEVFRKNIIDIPVIVVMPKGEEKVWYEDFDLDLSEFTMSPVPETILIRHLQNSSKQARLGTGHELVREPRLENYLLRALVDYIDVDYDRAPALFNKLATQVVEHFRARLNSESELYNVMIYHQRTLADLVHRQITPHLRCEATGYEARVTHGFRPLKGSNFSHDGGKIHDFRHPVAKKKDIRGMLFGGFRRGLYEVTKFDADGERRFACILEDDQSVEKWVRPAKNDFSIFYRNNRPYHPDFVVETKDAKYLCEVKKTSGIMDEDVQDKAQAAALWCRRATAHTRDKGGKAWHYLLMPDTRISENMSFEGCVREFLFTGTEEDETESEEASRQD